MGLSLKQKIKINEASLKKATKEWMKIQKKEKSLMNFMSRAKKLIAMQKKELKKNNS